MKNCNVSRTIVLIAALIWIAFPLAAPAFAQENGGRFIIGHDFTLRAGEVIDGGLAVFGGSVTLEKGSHVRGDVFVMGGDLDAAGTIDGSVAVIGGDIRLRDEAIITGSLSALGGELQRAEGARVAGDILSGRRNWTFPSTIDIPKLLQPAIRRGLQLPWLGVSEVLTILQWLAVGIFSALMLGALSLLVILLFEKPARIVEHTLLAAPWASLGMGLLTIVGVFTVSLILTITICMIPIALLLLLALALGMFIGWVVAGLILGDRLLRALGARDVSPLLAVLTGVIMLALISRIPCLGGLLGFLAAAAGLGAVVLTRAGSVMYPAATALPVVPDEPQPPAEPSPQN